VDERDRSVAGEATWRTRNIAASFPYL